MWRCIASIIFWVVFFFYYASSFFLGVKALPSKICRRGLSKVVTTCANPNQVALTFDDGPWQYAYDVVKSLNNAGAKGTFFLNGDNYDCIYSEESVKRVQFMLDNGHQIASHTWSHPYLIQIDKDEMHTEFDRINVALQKVTGRLPAFMRPPYGDYNNDVRQVAGTFNQTIVIWSYDSGDSVGASIEDQKAVYDSFVAEKPSNAVFLNHEVYDSTAHELLPYALETLKGAGYELVTLAECLNEKPYLTEAAPGARDDSWTCE